MTRRLVFAALVFACGCAAAQPRTAPSPKPALIVLIVVDQMRTDYLDRGMRQFTGGLRRLTSQGTWFREAAYPYLNTVTCAGHATIGTGALPYRHGMVLNSWWDRETARPRPCTSDEAVRNIGYQGKPAGGDSARALLAPTLAQTLGRQTGGRSVAISLKPRSAIPMVGGDPTAVVWFNEQTGWTTSTAFTREKLPWLQSFFEKNPISADAQRTWARLLPADAYQGPDDADGERFPQGWKRTFPHVLASAGAAFTAQWQRSPFADEYLGRMAGAAVDALALGRSKGVDLLAVSFSALDLAGHQFGPESHEVQDLVLRLDQTIGALLEHLDRSIGQGGYVVGLSADHGVGPITEQVQDSGRQTSEQTLAAINRALVPFFGQGKHAVHAAYTDLYLAPGVMQKLRDHPKAAASVLAALEQLPGIARAFFADEIASPERRTDPDPVRRAAALSYYPNRSGDVIIVPKPGWMLSSTSAATHGTLYWHDQRVPLVFYGAGVPAARRDTPATPADLAPTLAALVRVPFAAPDGRPLVTAK